MKCMNCGAENKNTNIKCECCGAELRTENNFLNKDYSQVEKPNIDLNSRPMKVITTVILVIILAPWFLAAVAFTGVSAYSIISDNNKSKGYSETVGTLVRYDRREKTGHKGYTDSGNPLCTGVYEYTVDGVTYQGSPKQISNKSDFEQTILVKYNPDNPSEYVMDSHWNILLISGIVMILVVVGIFIAAKIYLNKKLDRANSIINKENF